MDVSGQMRHKSEGEQRYRQEGKSKQAISQLVTPHRNTSYEAACKQYMGQPDL